MIHYPKKIVVIVFLATVFALSCKKQKLPPTGSSNHPNAQTGPADPQGGRVFTFFRQSSYTVSTYTMGSAYILYDNGVFALRYTHNGGFDYRGKYKEAQGEITFEWEGWSTAGPWGATGLLSGDTLTIAYNEVMTWTDFEDAVYLRKR